MQCNNWSYICRCRKELFLFKAAQVRNTMGQGCLSSLALLAIERTLVKSLEKTPSWYERVTEHFLEKERRAAFTYK